MEFGPECIGRVTADDLLDQGPHSGLEEDELATDRLTTLSILVRLLSPPLERDLDGALEEPLVERLGDAVDYDLVED
jgi:hypothetical protein